MSAETSDLTKDDPAAGVVAGDSMDRGIYDFIRSCAVYIEEEQDKPLPDNALIAVLCDAVRLSREYVNSNITGGAYLTRLREQMQCLADERGAASVEAMRLRERVAELEAEKKQALAILRDEARPFLVSSDVDRGLASCLRSLLRRLREYNAAWRRSTGGW